MGNCLATALHNQGHLNLSCPAVVHRQYAWLGAKLKYLQLVHRSTRTFNVCNYKVIHPPYPNASQDPLTIQVHSMTLENITTSNILGASSQRWQASLVNFTIGFIAPAPFLVD